MQMREYKFQYQLNGKNIVRIEAVSDTVPTTMPASDKIDGFPQMWEPETIRWAAGSLVYVVETGDTYMANESGVFKKVIKSSSSGGSGGTGGDTTDADTTYF